MPHLRAWKIIRTLGAVGVLGSLFGADQSVAQAPTAPGQIAPAPAATTPALVFDWVVLLGSWLLSAAAAAPVADAQDTVTASGITQAGATITAAEIAAISRC